MGRLSQFPSHIVRPSQDAVRFGREASLERLKDEINVCPSLAPGSVFAFPWMNVVRNHAIAKMADEWTSRYFRNKINHGSKWYVSINDQPDIYSHYRYFPFEIRYLNSSVRTQVRVLAIMHPFPIDWHAMRVELPVNIQSVMGNDDLVVFVRVEMLEMAEAYVGDSTLAITPIGVYRKLFSPSTLTYVQRDTKQDAYAQSEYNLWPSMRAYVIPAIDLDDIDEAIRRL